MQEGRVCKLVEAGCVQHVTYVMRAAQRHQAPSQSQVQQSCSQISGFAGSRAVRRRRQAALCERAGP